MKVSICTAAYNQEKYIAQAIESVINQAVNFNYELIIGEDFSTDKTRQIILEYQKKFPDKIKLILNKENIGSKKNFNNIYNQCQGQYLAWLDGDDYWTDMNKLQIQADYLDDNPDCSLCCHDVNILYEVDKKFSRQFLLRQIKKDKLTTNDLLIRNFIKTCSVMYRANYFKEIPQWAFASSTSDWPLHLIYSTYGHIGYIRKIMANYRVHSASEHSSKTLIDLYRDSIYSYKVINKNLNYKFKRIIFFCIIKLKILIIEELILKISPKTGKFLKKLRNFVRRGQ